MEESSNGKFEDTQHLEAGQVIADVESVREVTVDEEEEIDTSIVPLPPKEFEEKSVSVSDEVKEAEDKSVSVSDEPKEAEEKSVLSVSDEPKEAEVSSSLTDVVSKGIEEVKDSVSETNNDVNPESKGNDLQNSWKNCCGLFELLRDSNRK